MSRDTLFHYTTAAGLLGILNSSTLWATDFRFLNDAQEAVYASELFVEALRALDHCALPAGHPVHDDPESFGREFADYRQAVIGALNSPDFPVYVTCFCESGDLLSQWRAYGSDHGYAIEVNADALTKDVQHLAGEPPEGSLSLVQVRYGRDAAAEVVSSAMREVSEDTNLGHWGVHAHYMALRLTWMLAGVKHPGFQEEREWRAVVAAELEAPDLVRLRATPMAIVPYIEIPLPRDAIVSVRVGPGRHVDVREAGVRRLLRSRECDVPVHHSEVPLRT